MKNKNYFTQNKLANEIIKKDMVITAKEVNSVLADSNLNIDQEKLDIVQNSEFFVFEEVNKDLVQSELFKSKLGNIKNKVPGIYIWTHKETGQKYVGSSTQLGRRLSGYINGTHVKVGKFIPLLYKDGLNKFKLEVLILNIGYEPNLELLIEQYYLLHKEFNLNTLKVVNSISGARSKALYMYNKEGTVLLYSSDTQEEFISNLGIHHSIFSNCLLTGDLYLNKYKLTNEPINTANTDSELILEEVNSMLDSDRIEFKSLSLINNQIIIKDNEGNSKLFNSVNECLEYLSKIGPSSKTTLLRRINSKILYHGYIIE